VPFAIVLAASGLTPVTADSPNAEAIEDLFWVLAAIAGLVALSVAVPLILFVVRYRSRGRSRMLDGPQIHGSRRLELLWTIVPIGLIAIAVAFTFYKLSALTLEAEAGEREFEITVDGRQFYWQYEYPNGVVAIDKLRAPADTVVKLRITAPEDDVQHSYWVPGLGGKFDAIPGEENTTEFRAKPGVYEGQCAEFCGLLHARMFTEIEVVPRAEFDSWLEEQARAQETGDSDLGEQIFAGVCAKCHGEEGQGEIGPGLGVGTVSNVAAVEQIVRNGRGRMPAVGRGWSERQMKALTDYLRERFSGNQS
jgi:cytochrome c oxidase subunit II